jgi:hypothetical protein
MTFDAFVAQAARAVGSRVPEDDHDGLVYGKLCSDEIQLVLFRSYLLELMGQPSSAMATTTRELKYVTMRDVYRDYVRAVLDQSL